MNAADRETAERHLAIWEEFRRRPEVSPWARRLPPALPARLLAHHGRAARSPHGGRTAAGGRRTALSAALLRPGGAGAGAEGRPGCGAVRGLRARPERLSGRRRRGPLRRWPRPGARTGPPG